VAVVNLDSIIRQQLHYVVLRDGVHLYWSYKRETLCDRNKVHASSVWWADPETICDDCLSELGREALVVVKSVKAAS
jgi:hypothetical protein